MGIRALMHFTNDQICAKSHHRHSKEHKHSGTCVMWLKSSNERLCNIYTMHDAEWASERSTVMLFVKNPTKQLHVHEPRYTQNMAQHMSSKIIIF